MDQDSSGPSGPSERGRGTPPEGKDPEKVVREPTEGVRIIGAEEAAEAGSRPDVVSRIPEDAPRFGDRANPTEDVPPPLRFPKPEADDPNTFGAVPIITPDSPPPPGLANPPADSGTSGHSWENDPPPVPVDDITTIGDVPRGVGEEAGGRRMASDEDDLGRVLGGRRARRGRGRRGRRGGEPEPSPFEDLLPPVEDVGVADEHDLPHWTKPATGEVPKVLVSESDDDSAVWSGLGSQTGWRDDHGHDEVDDFSDLSDLAETQREEAPAPIPAGSGAGPADFGDLPPPPDRPVAPPYSETQTLPEPEPELEPSLTASAPYPEEVRHRSTLGSELGHDDGSGAGRDLPMAIGVGVGLFVGFLILCAIGTAAVTLLVLVVIVMGVIEFFNAVRHVGYHPAVLPGLAATACFVLAVHWKGEPGFLLVTFLTLVVLMLWYVIGLQHERAVANIGITFLGVMWIGGLGSFGALLLALPNGIGLLQGAIIATVAYDVGAYAVGRQIGRTPISPSSPNKTVEGLAGGAVAAVVVSTLVLGIIGVFPWGVSDAFVLGLAVAIVAPIGDLCESMLKRDLGIKDMGSILPGHGGLLDRFDALLFVLPVTYFVFWLLEVYLNTP